MIDYVPDHEWFFCMPISTAVIFIALFGVVHPVFWIKIANVFRSELFIFMYVIIAFWCILSLALMYAILQEVSCLYVFWINYTVFFALVMSMLMCILFLGFIKLEKRRYAIWSVVGLVYYMITLYFVVVVNRHRKEVFGLQAEDCGDCYSSNTPPTNKSGRRAGPTDSTDATPTTQLPITTQFPTTAKTNTPQPTEMTNITMSTMTMSTHTSATSSKRVLRELVPLATDRDGYDQTTRDWVVDPFGRRVSSEEPMTLRSAGLDRVARLTNILLNSDECRIPHKPAHGWYTVRKLRGSSLKIKLRCDKGYKENSLDTKCKNNWWNRPIPQCRKHKQSVPLPSPGSGCVMPNYPENGMYAVADHAAAKPGDHVAGDNVILMVTCNQPYRAVDPYVICAGGRWRHAPPSCQKHCKLVFDATVEYKCLKAFNDKLLACSEWQPDGTIVVAACKPGHAHRGPFRYMRCRGVAWNHVVSCVPNGNFTR